MIKLGIELPDKNVYGVNLSKAKDGNPGVGGSEYLFALLGIYLKESSDDIDVCFYHYGKNKLPGQDKIVTDPYDMLKQMSADAIDLFIHQINKPSEWYQALRKTKLKAIAWAHVYPAYYEQREFIKTDNVKRIVFVGKEEYDAYIDSDLINKATCIFNMLDTKKSMPPRTVGTKEVTYIGSLVPAKGFHVLAKNWKKILESVPDARLNVIGTGRVYDRNAKLGKYGIAQDDYEKKFMQYLTTEDGEILPSVHFLGLLGQEKDNVFANTMVGVVNPTALTETFCMSAVEMELAEIPVVSRKKWGLLDTIKDKETGFLFSSDKEFTNDVVKLLLDKDLNIQMGHRAREFVQDTFEASEITKNWIKEIRAVYNEIKPEYLGAHKNFKNDQKWIKMAVRFIRFNLGIKAFPDWETMKEQLRRIKHHIK